MAIVSWLIKVEQRFIGWVCLESHFFRSLSSLNRLTDFNELCTKLVGVFQCISKPYFDIVLQNTHTQDNIVCIYNLVLVLELFRSLLSKSEFVLQTTASK